MQDIVNNLEVFLTNTIEWLGTDISQGQLIEVYFNHKDKTDWWIIRDRYGNLLKDRTGNYENDLKKMKILLKSRKAVKIN